MWSKSFVSMNELLSNFQNTICRTETTFAVLQDDTQNFFLAYATITTTRMDQFGWKSNGFHEKSRRPDLMK